MSNNIAIISMACRLPGAETIEEFWGNLKSSKETIHSFSDGELEQAGIEEQLILNPNYVKKRGIIKGVEKFDHDFFGISPYEASITDPQHKIFLEICWEALEKAGYSKNNPDFVVGVFAGCCDNTYLHNFLQKNNDFLKNNQAYQTKIANSYHFLTTKVSYLLNLKGSSINVNTACSTSLVAVVQACRSLITRDSDIALAGGITIEVPQTQGYLYQDGLIYSKDGKCRAFDEKASGTVPGNGAGVVLLKRLEDALKDGDNIEAIIEASATNNDGKEKAGYTAPSVLEQTRCIATALADIDNVDNIAYVETHGTGTILGDPIEITALTKAFGFFTQKKGFCAIGSVKTNIGHTDVAAGVAGLIKTALVLKNRAIPASLNFKNPNPHISFSKSPFYVCDEYKTLEHREEPLYAGVSSFGIGGTNAHIILKEPPQKKISSVKKPSYIIPLSAKTPDALSKQQDNLLNYLEQQNINDNDLDSIAYTLQTTRNEFTCRKALICSDTENLKHLLSPQINQNILTSKNKYPDKPKIIFLFQGQGNLYNAALHDIYNNEPIFKSYFDESCQYLDPELKKRVLGYIVNQDDESDRNINDPKLQQITTFIIEYSLAKTYIKYGIKPDILLGHSLGEYVAITISGIISLEDAIKLINLRAKLTSKLPKGLMLSVPLPSNVIAEYIKGEKLSIAAINSPNSCVISGSSELVTKFQTIFDDKLKPNNKKCTLLKIPFAFHSKSTENILNEYSQALDLLNINFNPPSIPIITTVSGKPLNHELTDFKNHLVDHFRKKVLFSECIEKLTQAGHNIFLEIGLGLPLSALIKQHQDDLITIPSLASEKEFNKNKINQLTYFNRALGLCWINFIDIDWATFNDNKKKNLIPLPTYPFTRKDCWINPSKNLIANNVGPFISEPYWELSPAIPQKNLEKKENWLIFEDDYKIADKLCAKLTKQKQNIVKVKIGKKFKQISKNHYQINPKEKNDYDQLVKILIDKEKLPNHILHLWSTTKKDLPEKQTLENGFLSLINIFQTLKNNNHSDHINLNVITNHSRAIVEKDIVVPEKSTMLGFCLVLPQETETLARIIDTDILSLSNNDQTITIDNIFNDLSTQPIDPTIIYRNNLRLVNKFKKTQSLSSETPNNYLKQKGVYIITGGLGRIGLELAEFLAKNYKANLILIGRNIPAEDSPNTKDKKKLNKIQKIKKKASSLNILKGDVANHSQMKKLFAEIKTKFPQVDGIFHLAASINSSTLTLIKDIKVDQAYEQFASKIVGTKVLAKLTPKISPKFCVVFSSLSSIIGGTERCSYAASNCGLDSLIESYQNKTKTKWIGINWDAWQNEENITNRSLLSLPQGLKILQNCLEKFNSSRFVVTMNDLNSSIKEWVNYQNLKSIDVTQKNENSQPELNIIDIKSTLKQIFEKCLGTKPIDIKKDFYDLGGSSLALLRLHEMIEQAIPNKVKMVDLLRNRSIYDLTKFLENRSKTSQPPSPSIVKIKSSGKKQPIFLIHPVGGTAFCFVELAKYLQDIDHPILVIQDPTTKLEDLPFKSIEETAKHYLKMIKSIQNNGPFLLGGYSYGASIAFEIANQLEKQGENTSCLFIIDGWAKYLKNRMLDRQKNHRTMDQIVEEISTKMPNFINNRESFVNTLWKRTEILVKYKPEKIKTKIVLLKAHDTLPEYLDIDHEKNHWQNYSTKPVKSYIVDGDHTSMVHGDGVKQIATIIKKYI